MTQTYFAGEGHADALHDSDALLSKVTQAMGSMIETAKEKTEELTSTQPSTVSLSFCF